MLIEQSVAQFLDDLASSASTPGGGGGAALAGAMGAALVAMVANLTVGQEKFKEVDAEMRTVLAEAERLRGESSALVDDDATAFNGVSAAYKLPRSTDDEKKARTAAIQQALKAAARPPLAVATHARAILELCPTAARLGNPNLISDAATGAHLALAALEGGRINVEVNLALVKDTAWVEETSAALKKITVGARSLVEETERICQERG